jgi:hypothetical protein
MVAPCGGLRGVLIFALEKVPERFGCTDDGVVTRVSLFCAAIMAGGVDNGD